MSDSTTLSINSPNVEYTVYLGVHLGSLLSAGHVICLSGSLGAGKTTLVRGLGQGWQSDDRITSPTYVLVNIYRRQRDTQRLYHIDAYRLESPEAVWSIGLDDILDSHGAVIIEWPERIREFLPTEHLWIDIQHGLQDANRRYLVLTSYGEHHCALVQAFQKDLML